MKNSSLALFRAGLSKFIDLESDEPGAEGFILKQSGKRARILYIQKDVMQKCMTEKNFLDLQSAHALVEGGALAAYLGGAERYIGVDVEKLDAAIVEEQIIRDEFRSLRAQVKELEAQLHAQLEVRSSDLLLNRVLRQLSENSHSQKLTHIAPKKFTNTKMGSAQPLAGVPVIVLSDTHHGEVILGESVNYKNEFNSEISKQRIERVFNSALEQLFSVRSGQRYDGLVIALGGDMLSGIIHDDLCKTNDAGVLDALTDLHILLSSLIVMASSMFPWVLVVAVPGNHGRLDKKPSHKRSIVDNFDYVLYRLLASTVSAKLGEHSNVSFDVSQSGELRFDVYGTRFLLTHGDTLIPPNSAGTSSGGYLGGFWPALSKAVAQRKAAYADRNGATFDYLICGHFHRQAAIGDMIVNGSTKGYDELCLRHGYAPERATQTMFIVHPDNGITEFIKLYADEQPATGKELSNPVTTYSKMRPQSLVA